MTDVFTAALTADEYRILLDIKYRAHVDQIEGWALCDKTGRVRGWHPRQPGSPTWTRAASALRAFVPDASQRRKLGLLGYEIIATTGTKERADLLLATRGDFTDKAQP